jgi:MFS family permease
VTISRNTIILLIACTGVFVEALDIAILNLSIPLIQKQFSVSTGTVQWLQTLYVLLYGSFLIIGGKLSDVSGRKRVFLVGIALFFLASIGAGFSASFGQLAGFRALQGLAAALVMPSALSLITNTFTELTARSKAIALFSSFAAIGSGSGLSLGGIIATYAGWQWVFFINVPVLLLIGGLALRYIPADSLNRTCRTPDLLSGGLLAFTLLLITYGVHTIGQSSSPLWHQFVLIGLIVLSIRWLRFRTIQQTDPLIDVSLLRAPNTLTGLGVTFLLGAFFTGFLFVQSITLQQYMGYSAARAGILLFPFSLLSAVVGKLLIPALLRRMAVLQMGILGMSMMALGAVALIGSLQLGYPLWLLLISVAFISGFGMAICFTSLTLLVIADIAVEHQGLASSVATTAYFLGGGLGLSILSLLMPSETDVTNGLTWPAVGLLVYAVVGVVWLGRHAYVKRRQSSTQDKHQLETIDDVL